VFPDLKLGVDMDHIGPSVRGFKGNEAAAPIVKANGLQIVEGNGVSAGAGWIRDPDRMIYQLSDADANRGRGAIPSPPFGQILMKDGERLGAPFVPIEVREITLRAADLTKTGNFLATVFGGEMKGAGRTPGRRFQFGGSTIHVIQRAATMPRDVSLDHMTIA